MDIEENISPLSRRHTFTASVINIAEQKPKDPYITIRMRLLTTRVNRNMDSVTEAFINEIVDNQDRYRCIPLVADVRKMEDRDYKGLGHLLDAETGIFHTTEIGSFYSFEKEYDEYGACLIGTARVAKRNRKVIAALMELFNGGNLNFSFEIMVRDERVENGVTIIDVSEENTFIGAAVVWNPAYIEAKALALVAEVSPEDGVKKIMPATSYYIASDISIMTISTWVWEMLKSIFGDGVFAMQVERVCMDCCVVYQEATGRTLKIEYIVEKSGLLVTDIFEVTFTRKTGGQIMENIETAGAEVNSAHAHSQSHTHSLASHTHCLHTSDDCDCVNSSIVTSS